MEEAKPVKESSLVTVRLMMPMDANVRGYVYGGSIMKYMDEIAGVVAARHARMNVVTASIDRMDFYAPVYLGNMLILKASVNYVGRTSMEVGVRIEAEDLKTRTIAHTGSSYLTFVGLDETGRPTLLPRVIPETGVEKRRSKQAEERRRIRLQMLHRMRPA